MPKPGPDRHRIATWTFLCAALHGRTGACAAFVMAKEWKFEAHDSNDGRYWAYTYLIIFDGFLK